MKHFIKISMLLAVLLCFLQNAGAQDILKGKDLSQIKVDQMSDADVLKLKQQLSANGMTIEQAEQVALSKGMPASEFAKLKQRIESANSSATGTSKLRSEKNNENQTGRLSNSQRLDTARYDGAPPKPLIDPLIFGSELFSSNAPSFDANMRIATPVNYVLGPDDVIQLAVYGIQEYSGEFQITPEGNVNIPNVGVVKLSGLTIEDATQKLRSAMGNSGYASLKSGSSKLSVDLGKIRSIRVTVIGSNFPNNYTLSALSTVYNALFVAGGPAQFGSFREIELVRNNKVVRKIDLYKLLLHGDQGDNVALKDNDIIRIPAYKVRVQLQGQVKRPGIFEVLPSERFTDILAFASGFTDTAYRASVKVFQRNDRERKVLDLESSAFASYQPQSGDLFNISRILNRFENRVKLTGAVFRPDVYELTEGLKVADLIRRADGLKEDALTDRGQVLRFEDDLTPSIIAFDVKKALAGDPMNNVLLKREDEVLISSLSDLRDSFKVTIQGEIRMPGDYQYVQRLTLKDLILQAGNFTDAAYKNIEIARIIKRDSLAASDYRANIVINTEIDGELALNNSNIILQPFDVVTIRRKAGYMLPQSVIVSGQAQYPGPYALESRNDRVSDILRRARGYMPDAYLEGAYIRRYNTEYDRFKANFDLKVKQYGRDSIPPKVLEDTVRKYINIPIDLPYILEHVGSIEDLVMRANDELVIPKFDEQVKVNGAVLLTTEVPYKKGNTVRDYISEAGGFSGNAWKKKVYVVYANGKAATTKHFLFFKFYPRIRPGASVWVPDKPERTKLSSGEMIGIASALASLAGVVIALLRL